MSEKNINVVIMGPQGSGKGTQARLLAEKYDLQLFETGDILRKIARQNTKLGRMINKIINKKGEIVPWNLMKEKILSKKIDELEKEKGIVFDGTPRILKEAVFWERKLKKKNRKIDYVFYIDISKKESIRRLSNRKQCGNDHLLVVGKDVRRNEKKCPVCGSRVYQREDDTPQKILNRLNWSKKLLKPVVDYYKNKNMLIRIDGEQSIENVHKEIVSHIK